MSPRVFFQLFDPDKFMDLIDRYQDAPGLQIEVPLDEYQRILELYMREHIPTNHGYLATGA